MRLLFLFLLAAMRAANAPSNGGLIITVYDVRDTTGVVVAGLFTDERTFLKKPVLSRRASPEGDSAIIVFEDLPPGEYAISVFHDRNLNGELDVNRVGIPTEGFGFGNDAMGLFGPPSFGKASVRISESEVRASVNLRYF